MDIVGILAGIGVNQTFAFQLAIFLIVFYFLIFAVFRPYQKAYMARRQNTEGNEEHAGKLIDETKGLATEYESSAKKINDQIKRIYDESRAKAKKESDAILSSAKQESERLTNEKIGLIENEATRARDELKAQGPKVSQLIVAKLLGKES